MRKHPGFRLDLRPFGADGTLLLAVGRPRLEVRRHDGRATVLKLTGADTAHACERRGGCGSMRASAARRGGRGTRRDRRACGGTAGMRCRSAGSGRLEEVSDAAVAATWSLPSCPLDETTAIARALGIGALDLGCVHRAALDRAALLAEPDRLAGQVRGLGIDVASLYHLFGALPEQRNLADPAHHDANERDFRAVSRFCKAAAIPTMFVLPGICNPGQGRAEAMMEAVRVLHRLVAIAHHDGVQLTIEPHAHSFLESPGMTLDLLDRVPGLKLTLDYAQFVCLGWRQDEIDALAPSAAHVHLRQARPGALQARFGKGTINVPALLGTLRDCGYDGCLALEALHQDSMDTLHDDVLTETVAMRDPVRSWVG